MIIMDNWMGYNDIEAYRNSVDIGDMICKESNNTERQATFILICRESAR